MRMTTHCRMVLELLADQVNGDLPPQPYTGVSKQLEV